MWQSKLIKKVNLKSYDVTVLLTNICNTHIAQYLLPNIWRSKGNQTMKFGQLTEYNMRNISLEKSYTKCGGEPSSRSLFGKLKLSMFLDQ